MLDIDVRPSNTSSGGGYTMIRVGIIGLGRICDVHYPAYRGSKLARIHAVCDTNEETALKRMKEWKADVHYTDYRDLLADPSVDAVEIITPHALHERMVIDAAAAGKHIAVQKPMTISMESADRMLEAVRAKNIVFKVTDNYAFYPPIALARSLIEAGEIGDPSMIHIRFIGGGTGGWQVPSTAWEWRIRENDEGCGRRGLDTFDHGHHLWTAAWYLIGGAERTAAWIDSADGIIDTPSTVMWKYRDKKCYGVCEFAHAEDLKIPSKYYANDEWIEITGSKGILFVHRCTGKIHTGPAVSMFTSRGWKRFNAVKCDWGEGFIGAANNFFRAIRDGERPLLSGDDAREIMRFSLSIQRSASLRREVYLDELDSSFPSLLAWKRRRNERKEASPSKGLLARLFGGGDSGLAPRGAGLVRDMLARFDPAKAGDWTCSFGLHLCADGGCGESMFAVSVNRGVLSLVEGSLPGDAAFVIRAPAGTWAAIILKKKRIETAFIQGKLKIEGKVDDAMVLRKVFGL